jgi:uncharacterized protein (TIGR02300 family)
MKLASFEAARSARGSKRVCEACETRFYDLLRSPIVCPSCGAEFTPRIIDAKPPVVPKGRWRQDYSARPKLVAQEIEASDGAAPEEAVEDITAEDASSSREPDDDSIPEEVQDDDDVSGLLDVDNTKEG